jgi:hypothetical protein
MDNINLENLATKDDLKQYATKEDLKKETTRLEDAIFRLDVKVDKVRDELKDEIQEKFDKLLDSADKQMIILKRLDEENVAHVASYRRHDETLEQHIDVLDDHEKRLKILEVRPATA